MIDLFLRGGVVFMLPLLFASIAVIGIGIERCIRYRRASVDYLDFLEEIQETVRKQGAVAARSQAAGFPGPVARVWHEGLSVYRLPFPLVRERMESVAMEEISRLERHLAHLAVIGQVAPLVGILGTVWGMIASFQGVEGGLRLGGGIEGQLLAGGIWQALVTTAAGLIVAIPALLLHHYLRVRVDQFVEHLDRSTADLVASLVPLRSRSPESKPVTAKAN